MQCKDFLIGTVLLLLMLLSADLDILVTRYSILLEEYSILCNGLYCKILKKIIFAFSCNSVTYTLFNKN